MRSFLDLKHSYTGRQSLHIHAAWIEAVQYAQDPLPLTLYALLRKSRVQQERANVAEMCFTALFGIE